MNFIAVAIASTIVVLSVLLVVDPYATGRFTWVDHPVSFDTTASKSSVSRIRNPHFNAAVIGNSTLQTVDPERLNVLTGQSFSQITVPGSGPMEQAAMLRYMARERGDGIRTLVIGLDLSWCNPKAAWTTANPFPFWLYEESAFRYVIGLFSADNVEAVPRRMRVLLGHEKPKRLDGYWNYELYVPARPYPYAPARAVEVSQPPHSAAKTLMDALKSFPENVRAILVFAPIYRPETAAANFEEMSGSAKCKAELLAAARTRPNSAVVDRWVDSDLNRNPKMFLDAVHFREPIARDIEQGVAHALANRS